MDALSRLAQDALKRLGTDPYRGKRPQLLAAEGDRGLVRTSRGLAFVHLPDAEVTGERYDLAPLIDHTLLKAEATADQIDTLCQEAAEHRFASVCVNPAYVAMAAGFLASTGVRVCTVVGFPLGATTARQKAWEAEESLGLGATEIDMVIALGALRSGDWRTVETELRLLRTAVPKGDAVLKVILETSLLTNPEKVRACKLALEAGLDFVKTSTGFAPGGATEADVALLRRTVGPDMGVKASGGIRDYPTALAMVRAGATRLGLSASLAVVQGIPAKANGY